MLVVLAFLVESTVEYFVAAPIKERGMSTFWVRYVALAFGIVAAIAFNANVFDYFEVSVNPLIGQAVTGLILGRGSNFVSDFAGKFLKK